MGEVRLTRRERRILEGHKKELKTFSRRLKTKCEDLSEKIGCTVGEARELANILIDKIDHEVLSKLVVKRKNTKGK